MARYEQVRHAEKNMADHKEKLLLAHLISDFEERKSELPEVDPVELIKIRMEDFGYKPVDLAKEYGVPSHFLCTPYQVGPFLPK